jgi:ubiquinone/menaquinone biosynthesis C-methylase UbiE
MKWMVSEIKTSILERNLLSEQYINGRWVAFNRSQLLSHCLEKSNKKTSVILDLGCGNGRYSTLILKGTPKSCLLVGVDVYKEYIKEARKNNPRRNIMFLVADGQDLPFKNKCFDLTISKDLLHHVRHPFEVLREISRVSRGGVVIIEANKYNPIMLLNEKYGNHQHLSIQQLEHLTRYLQVDSFSLKQVHAYPFTLRLKSLNPIACIWNASVSIFLIVCNKVPYVSEFALRTFSFLFVPSFNILMTTAKLRLQTWISSRYTFI